MAIDMSNEAVTAQIEAMETNDWVAPDCVGQNFFDQDISLQGLITLYLDEDLRDHMLPHFRRLGEIAGGRLDELSRLSDRHEPILHPRNSRGVDEEWIEFHPAYREMEQIGFGDFGIHCMSRKPGAFGWEGVVPALAKYVFQYLFVQSEFGLMCPISVTDTSALLIQRYGSEEVKERFLPGMLSQDMSKILKGAQFMTEKTGGSDVSNIELEARLEDGQWRLYGEKWFCSCADGDVALLLARPQGAVKGNNGLGLFALPRHLDDGNRNRYRIVRLKEKLGTRSMASGEIIFDGAVAYALGEAGPGVNQGLKMMMDQVNMSRLSHGVRAAAMMRRCLNEAMVVARNRIAFGEKIIDKPLLRRQLMKLMVPTEQALSMCMFIGQQLELADAGDQQAERLTRILTPLLKFRACRDNISVATGAMEIRGGNGFIEDWVNPKLVRDAHTGVLWEGTSNIKALDVTKRAIAKVGAHINLAEGLRDMVKAADGLPGQFRGELDNTIDHAVAFAEKVALSDNEPMARKASDALYHVVTAVLLATEGAALGTMGEDSRRLIMARMVIDHRLRAKDPLAIENDDSQAVAALLSDTPVDLATAQALAQEAQE
ncbi:MAG: acyl-CoA dehydrogenase family protein [Gammaproteobacteria bacterium]|nr:acyl-CoA dehydrogenase family protein [Gammaproteobacteria bacterium]